MTAESGFILEKHRTETSIRESYINQLEVMVEKQARIIEDLQDRLRTMEMHHQAPAIPSKTRVF